LVGEADRRETLEALIPAPSVDDRGLSRHDIGPGLRDLLGAAAVVELLDNRLLGRDQRSGLCDVFLAWAGEGQLQRLPVTVSLASASSRAALASSRSSWLTACT